MRSVGGRASPQAGEQHTAAPALSLAAAVHEVSARARAPIIVCAMLHGLVRRSHRGSRRDV
eukprot:5137842-Pleurochrysis_carterae.AAC.1